MSERFLLCVVALLMSVTCWAAPQPASESTVDRDAVAAFARLYGVVRYFHPSDAAQEVDWNRYAVLGARRALATHDQKALRKELSELFSAVAVGVEVTAATSTFAQPRRRLPAGAKQVGWRHLGLGDEAGGAGGVYASRRSNRQSVAAITGFATLMQSVGAAELRGKRVRLSAQVKAAAGDDNAHAALWLQVNRPEKQAGFFDNMDDHPIRDPQWREYQIEGPVADDALSIGFGVTGSGAIEAGFDDVRLQAQQADGSWKAIEIANPGFEESAGWLQTGDALKVKFERSSDAAPEGKQWQRLAPAAADNSPPFDAELDGNAVAEFALGAGLKARVPLVLSDAEARIGKRQRHQLDALQAKLKAQPAPGDVTELAVRYADVVVAWNVYRHFFPYWAEVGVDWDEQLPQLLETELDPATRQEHTARLQRMLGRIGDGHGTVRDEAETTRPMYLPLKVRWIDNQLVVTTSAVPTQAQVGDIVLSIDATIAAQAFDKKRALTSGSEQFRDRAACALLAQGQEGQRSVFELQHADGTQQQIAFEYALPKPPSERRPAPIAEISPGVWYVDLQRADMQAITPKLDTLAAARAVLFDLRGYPGDAGSGILPYLLANEEHTHWMHVPQFLRPFAQIQGWTDAGWDLEPKQPHISGKAVFMTDGRAISYAESVLGYVADLHLGSIVGSASAGTNGNINRFNLPGGYQILFTGMRVTHHDGTTPQHLVGILPTVASVPTLAGVRAGRDEVLDSALALATRAPAAQPGAGSH